VELPHDFDDWPFESKQKFLAELKYNWKFWARPEQIAPPDDDWDIWMLLAGRGFGKTRTGAEYIKQVMMDTPNLRVGVIGQTIAAVRDVCMEGESGLLEVLPREQITGKGKYNRSLGQLRLANGSMAFSFSGTDPEKLRGFQSHYLWMDELAAWQYEQSTFDMALLGLRLGRHPRIIITTTPKPSPLVVDLVNRSRSEPDRVRITTGSTFDNAANLPESQLAALRARYDGTTLGRQELYAELILDDPNALWKRSLLEETRVPEHSVKLKDLVEVVVAIDPSMSALGERDSETGIVVAGKTADNHCYILADESLMRPSPDTWARHAIHQYKKWQANKIVAEVNQGYDLVQYTLHTIDDKVPLKKVYATRGGKFLRAEPIAALYEQGRVHHVGMFKELEDQMTQWIPGKASPDRLDAMVWAVTQLMLGGGLAEFHSPSSLGRLPGIV
jgi:phage terminase large subunit-like protein